MSGDFKWRHYRGEVILWAVRWYCRYGISYRDLEAMLEERGVDVDCIARSQNRAIQSTSTSH
ncbi:hypothetical protein [Pseudovibrio sp. Tun.PSC04-5.I4]|uniref:hypothetical protein n=1 Tax=Pseudovibrio sp. Tun.PSC04-5.I4 TaxID=1798213 RepID=UPI000AFDD287|nr:hypothetical protein [Pseudovibrio sp. Tun.PSC04-5.I4]